MEIRALKMAYFSPTGTTKAIVQGIARGIAHPAAEVIDITNAEARRRPLQSTETDLLVVAMPVYVGRVPALATQWLSTIHAQNTPAVCVVVYGNREYDDALLELKEILVARGCRPIAGAAFIGEHSFSSSETPIAVGRPDADDLEQAEHFGKTIKAKLLALSTGGPIPDLTVPGHHPYRELETRLSADFIAVSDQCIQCGVCAEACPVAAIDAQDSRLTDTTRCILCCACIKSCAEHARAMKQSKIKDIAIHLHHLCKARKEPALFY